MQMAIAATNIMNYYLDGALQTLDMMSRMFPKPLLTEQKSFLRIFPLEGFVTRSAIIDHCVKYGMKQRTIDRYLGQLKGTYLEYSHGKYKLSDTGKMAISGGNRQQKYV